ncbi:MAG: DUF945 family protein [Pseudomonadota bacterium]
MKKLISIVVLVAVLLAAAPGLTGRIARNRIDQAFESVPEKAPYLKIVENKWTSGWFSSEHLTTFEIVLPQLTPAVQVAYTGRALSPATALPVAQEIPNAPAPQSAPLRISLREHMLHGFFLGPGGIGLARMQTELVAGDDVRKKLVELFGTEQPVQVVTRLGIFGGTSTTISAKAHSLDLGKVDASLAGGTVAWDDFKLTLDIGRHASSYALDGRMPRIEVGHDKSGLHARLNDITLHGKGKRIVEDLYGGGANFGIGKLELTGKDKTSTVVNDLKYDFEAGKKGDFLDYVIHSGSGEVHNKTVESTGVQLKEVHFDYTLRHLHIDSLQKVMAAIRAVQARAYAGSANPRPDELLQAMKDPGLELIKHDPEVTIDRFGIVTAQGAGILKGTIKAEGITDADLSAGRSDLMQKLHCDFNLEIAQALVDKIPNGNTMAGLGIDNGFLKRDGDKLVSHIEWRRGALLVNGKAPQMPQGLPLPGISPPAAPK